VMEAVWSADQRVLAHHRMSYFVHFTGELPCSMPNHVATQSIVFKRHDQCTFLSPAISTFTMKCKTVPDCNSELPQHHVARKQRWNVRTTAHNIHDEEQKRRHLHNGGCNTNARELCENVRTVKCLPLKEACLARADEKLSRCPVHTSGA
jgi:hypothetical protein